MGTTKQTTMNITPYDIGTYLVHSETRDEVAHVVDLHNMESEDTVVCTCEAYTLGKMRPCKHIAQVIHQLYAHIEAPNKVYTYHISH